MFATLEGTVDQVLERRREGRRREVRAIGEQQARLAQRLTEIVREADDEGDWHAAGCSSSAQWLAQISSSDHRTAKRITHTSDALRELPALDHALSTGALTLDQVAAAAEFATPESDAELARVALGKAPSAIAQAARTLAPPNGAGRPGAVRASLVEHDLDPRATRAGASADACRWSRAQPSSKPSGTSPSPNAHSTNTPAAPSSGSNRPPTRSSPSLAAAVQKATSGAVPPR